MAVSFIMDGSPVIGEQVAVIGQGVVGLLTTALLSGWPWAVCCCRSVAATAEWALRLGGSNGCTAGSGADALAALLAKGQAPGSICASNYRATRARLTTNCPDGAIRANCHWLVVR